jgi:hypothetical protein
MRTVGIMVVTNNEKVRGEISRADCKLHAIDGTASDVLELSRDMILAGWSLASDPLAGHRFRGNPYHTVFLRDGSRNGEAQALDILRVEKCMRPHEEKDFFGTADGKLDRDYCELDFSIAMNTWNGMIQNLIKGCRL